MLKGGSYVNYYMFHGGTNFGRSAGGPFITTSYDYDAPIDEYGLVREPKYGHLKELHRTIKLCESALVSSDPTVISLGKSQQAHIFSKGHKNCAAFLTNFNSNSAARVMLNNMHYNLPPWSVSILSNCKNVVFNTAKLVKQDSEGHCNSECKTIERAC